jgi:hypothetical protein
VYSRTQGYVFLDQELCRSDDVTEQGLGHDCGGLSDSERCAGAPDIGSARAVVFSG